MSPSPTRPLFLVALLLLPVPVLADPPAKPPSKDRIARWIKELGDDDFTVRENASKKLWEAGEAAEAAVNEAVKHSPDAEVSRRALELANKFRLGIYPNTPPKIVELIGKYQGADENGKLAVVREFFGAGAPGCAALLRIARAEKSEPLRRRLLGQIGREASQAVPSLLAEGGSTNLETLLNLAITAEAEEAMPNYTAYWLLRGRLDEAIAHWKSEAAKPDAKRAHAVLAYLYRAKGDLPAARAAAEKADLPELVEAILFEQSDWKTLASRPPSGEQRRPIEALGYRAAYQRLAGDMTAFNATVADIQKHAESQTGNDIEAWYAAKVLLLNDRPTDAKALLAKTTQYPEIRFEVLAAQGRFSEALDLARDLPAGHPKKPLLELLRARVLYILGDKDEAQAIFARTAAAIKVGTPTQWQERLVIEEYRLGLREQAQDHCALVLAASNPGRASFLLGKVFPGRGDEAAALWTLLSQEQGDPSASMKKLRELLAGRATPKELAALHDNALKQQAQALYPAQPQLLMLALISSAEAAKAETLARTWLEKLADQGWPKALQRLGDRLAAKKDWDRAAARYAEAWEAGRYDPLPLFLRGHALVQAGKEKDGKLWIDRAHLLPLGNEKLRHDFADALAKRGLNEAARREWDVLRKVSHPGSFYAGDAVRRMGVDAAAHRRVLAAAELEERSMLRCLSTTISFLDNGAYVLVPEAIHRLRAHGLVMAGRFEEAYKEIAVCEALLPGDLDLPCRLVPALEKAGHKREADALYRRCRAIHDKRCLDYPKSARAHNEVAWLAAACRRDLDSGLEHAKKAVALAPEASGFLDTLAEIYFQRGDKEKALATARKVVEMSPGNAYYKRQLQRIEAGDPKAELPAQGEE